jgi:hypothetical protein
LHSTYAALDRPHHEGTAAAALIPIGNYDTLTLSISEGKFRSFPFSVALLQRMDRLSFPPGSRQSLKLLIIM